MSNQSMFISKSLFDGNAGESLSIVHDGRIQQKLFIYIFSFLGWLFYCSVGDCFIICSSLKTMTDDDDNEFMPDQASIDRLGSSSSTTSTTKNDGDNIKSAINYIDRSTDEADRPARRVRRVPPANAKFVCGFQDCGFWTQQISVMCEHTLLVDHRYLRAWRCGINGCTKVLNAPARLTSHRRRAHNVPKHPNTYVSCGNHPGRFPCLGVDNCRGAVVAEVASLVHSLGLVACEITNQIARVRRTSEPLRFPVVHPLPRNERFEQQLVIAIAEHDWPRPAPVDGVCCACLQSYDKESMVRCGERLPIVGDPSQQDADDEPPSTMCGPNSAWTWERKRAYCNRSYHCYCLMAATTIASGDIWLAAHVRMREFCRTLPRRPLFMPLLEQLEDERWRCTECSYGVMVPRPNGTRDPTRRAVPIIQALQRVAVSGNASPYLNRVLATLLQAFAACPGNVLSSLQAVGCVQLVPSQQQQRRRRRDDENNDNNNEEDDDEEDEDNDDEQDDYDVATRLHALMSTIQGKVPSWRKRKNKST
jgi:hypothetical protein